VWLIFTHNKTLFLFSSENDKIGTLHCRHPILFTSWVGSLNDELQKCDSMDICINSTLSLQDDFCAKYITFIVKWTGFANSDNLLFSWLLDRLKWNLVINVAYNYWTYFSLEICVNETISKKFLRVFECLISKARSLQNIYNVPLEIQS
jgi:hypothetical protein